MAKIGKIRFLNFTYNDNRHIYDQTLDFYNGEDTLLNLQNGGGKTVLVQMMMQPVIPKQKLKDRAFKSYFANSKAPVYIMIEWILDGKPEKVLTGIGIKRVLGKSMEDDTESIKVVTFISEYEGDSKFDIRNIELIEEERGIVKLVEFEKVLKNLSNAEKEGEKVWLFRWDLPDDKKEYTRRLLSYKINQTEWKNLMVRINEAEAGLNSFFNDCKSNGALIKKWFIPTIEEQLNRNGNLIENTKELIKNHAEQLVKNEDMIREREIFENFKEKSTELLKKLNEFRECQENSENNRNALGNAYLLVDEGMRSFDAKKDEYAQKIKCTEDGIKELEYERLSGEYHGISGELQIFLMEQDRIAEQVAVLMTHAEGLEFKKKQLQCAKLRDELQNLNGKIAKFETELEKENLQQEDIRNIMNDIEFSLKEKYEQKVTKLEKLIEKEKTLLDNEKSRSSEAMEQSTVGKKEIAGINDRLIDIRGRLAAFDESLENLKDMYQDLELKGMDNPETLGRILSLEEEEIESNLRVLKDRRVANSREIARLDKECMELRQKANTLSVDRSRKESESQLFEKEKNSILKILKSYQLGEDSLFDKERILAVLGAESERFTKLINDKNLDNSIQKKQLKQYESGKAFELTEELKRAFEDSNIFIEFGYEWLRTVSENKVGKLKLVKNNPFLPYSIIVSQKDRDEIRAMELKGFLSPVLPIIEREKLEEAVNATSRNNVHTVGNMDFLITFDDRILNKNYLREICDNISENIEKNEKIIENAREALKNIEISILKVEGFSYTKESTQRLLSELGSLTDELNGNGSKIKDLEKEIDSVREQEKDDSIKQSSIEKAKALFERKRKDIEALITRYEGYIRDSERKRVEEAALEAAKTRDMALEAEMAEIREIINGKMQDVGNLTSSLEKDRQNLQKYSEARIGKLLDEDITQLESKLLAYATKISGKVQNLRDILEDYRLQRHEKKELLTKMNLKEDSYIQKDFNEYAFNNISKELAEIYDNQKLLSEEKNQILFKQAEKNSDLKHMLRNIFERCGYESPKSPEHIREIDFAKEKSVLKATQKDLEKELVKVREQESKLQQIRFILNEYSGHAASLLKPQPIQGEIDFHAAKLIKELKGLNKLSQDMRNEITSLFGELENEFVGQAEMFKNLFKSILDGEKKYQPTHALNAFDRAYIQIDRKLEQHAIDLRKIDGMETCIIDNTLSYLRNVYDELNHIDRNSTIDVEGKRCKMLIISLPEKDTLETLSLKEYLRNTISHCVRLHKQGKSPENLLANEISTYDLFDRLVGMNRIEINLIKIEPNRLKKKTWKQVIEENSGGERFVSAFVVFISLLSYMRGEGMMESDTGSKVLIMDNPFGPITSEHLLKPLFEIARKYDTQMICLTDLKEHSIFDRFNLIYSLNVEREVGRDKEYIDVKTIKKDIQEEEDEMLSVSMFRIEDKSRFELVR